MIYGLNEQAFVVSINNEYRQSLGMNMLLVGTAKILTESECLNFLEGTVRRTRTVILLAV